ncbi:ATP-binding protein [Ramlibacter alkalitolerans]|uniref:histidine kinase n=1 Tax=Ramlibacter alkalitolerans TaxID=2039631 RepID=A0ABS1JTZ0_9BURK|nr:ATP-binding protein [Ramlibacter alkalitolerans]MBL0427035.1 response regulator [Ramlibacter alkalitolerans]
MTAGQDFLAGGGEMGQRIRSFDWAATPLGPIERWPQSLRSAVSILLPSKAQIAMFWGPDLITIYNDAYRPVFGAKHPGALGRPIREAWDELWRAGLKELFDGVLQTGEAFWAQDLPFFMERHGYREETYFDVSYDPVRDESGSVGGLFCIVSEKTGRVIGERRLRTLRDLARIAAHAQTTAEVFGKVGAVLRENAQDLPFALLYAPDEGDGATLVAQSGLEGSAAAPARLPASGGAWPLARELTLLSGDALASLGSLHGGPWPEPVREAVVLPLSGSGEAGHGWLVCGASPRRHVDDDLRDFVAMVASNIAAALDSARRSEHEHRRAEMLAELDRAKTTFFSNVSHEFRTPLTLLMAPLDDALADAARPLDPVQRERLELARRSSARLHKLVNSLLDFSRIEAGRTQASYVATDLAALTAELASSFRSAIEKAGLRLLVDTPPTREAAYVDRDFWEKIVLNLLSNAFKFTFEGRIAVRLRETAGAFELSVQDTGVGIPAQELPHVFQRFHRVEGTRSRTHEGSGIGLALVHDLVRLHGGEVAVSSREGEGSCFTVTIPAGHAHLDAARLGAAPTLASTAVAGSAYIEEALRWLPGQPTQAPAAAGSRPRIVLADDNADMRDYIRNLLAGSYEVEAVADGLAALQAVEARGADLVLSDVMMPGIDGLELVRRLRQQRATAQLPVLLLSARAGEGARIDGLDAGADDYLEKPFAAKELLARVAARLEISQLRRAAAREAQLREQQLRMVTDNAPVMLLQFDDQARYRFVNGPYAARVGWRVEDLVGRTIPEVLGEEAFALVREHVAAALAGQRVEFDARVPYPVLGARWMHGTYIPQWEDGRVTGFVSVLYDVTDRKLAQLRLQEQAQRFEKLNEVGLTLAAESDLQRIVQAVTDVATDLSAAEFGAFFYNVVNTAGESYMLYTLSGVPRERFARFGMPRNTAVFGPTFAGQGVVRVPDITQDPRYGHNAPHHGMPKGHLPVRSYLAVPVLSRAGEVLGGLFFGHSRAGVFTEEAERIVVGIAAQAAVAIDNARLHEQRLRLIEQLQESDRRKDEFIATLSHELRNPLAPLRNGLHLLKLRSPEAGGGVLEMMTRQVNQLVRLVDDLLEIARINRGTLALRKERVELHAVVQHAVETSEPLIRECGHTLQVALPDAALWLDGDAARLAQVLSNLLNNASRYTDRGGRIALEAAVEQGRVLLSVRDTGIGFEEDKAAQLFEMFRRGERSQGLGIGLALSRRLVEMHGGTLEGHSEGPGRGATFTLALPLEPDPQAPPPARRDAAGVAALRVLVVDDNRDAADTLRMLLDLLGAQARVAHDGESALRLFDDFAPEAVLLDLGMPGMDGYQVARQLRGRHPDWPGALIALTGWGQENDRRRTREAGFDHHLVKPVDLPALQELLATVADRRRDADVALR